MIILEFKKLTVVIILFLKFLFQKHTEILKL